mmetsp:Transcript_7284/g.23225  ORF Transcript_7284/g.23225 Transcript_7284/m.23225 type:complete len:249 (+) Transcript_7284:959-1705(+)
MVVDLRTLLCVPVDGVCIQAVYQKSVAIVAHDAHRPLHLLHVQDQQQADGSRGERALQHLLEPQCQVQLPGRVQQPDEEPRPAHRHIPESQEAVRTSRKVLLYNLVFEVMVPEAAAPAGSNKGREVMLVLHLCVGQKVLEARLEAVQDSVHGGPIPVKWVRMPPQAQVEQCLSHRAVAAEADELTALDEALRRGRPAQLLPSLQCLLGAGPRCSARAPVECRLLRRADRVAHCRGGPVECLLEFAKVA